MTPQLKGGFEEALIGTGLLMPEHRDEIFSIPEKYFLACSKAFKELKARYEKGYEGVQLSDGYDYFLVHQTQNVEQYKSIIKDTYTRVQAYNTIKRAENLLSDENQNVEEAISQISALTSDLSDSSTMTDLNHALVGVLDSIAKYKDGFADESMKTNLAFEKHFSGFERGKVYVIAARPAMGKSAFALEVARRIAKNGQPVGVMSLEMSNESLAFRLLTAEVGMDARLLKHGHLDDDKYAEVLEVASRLSEIPIYFDDNSFLNANTLRTRAHIMKKKHGIEMLIIDYLQLMTGSNETRERDIAEASRMCKVLSKELSIPVVALAQLNRGVEQRPNKRPLLSDLRESGAIEQDADVVMTLYRPEYYNKMHYGEGDPEDFTGDSTRDICEVGIVKNREGDTGIVRQKFIKKEMRFTNLDGYDLAFGRDA